MLSYEDAWANLKFAISDDRDSKVVDYIEELELAIKALDKQVPKTIQQYTFKCPTCGELIIIHKDYCYNCGQKLNWRKD